MIRQVKDYMKGGFEFNQSYWNNISDLTKKEKKRYLKLLKEEFL